MARKSFSKWLDHGDEVVEETRREGVGRDNKRYDKTKRQVQEARRAKRKGRNEYFDSE